MATQNRKHADIGGLLETLSAKQDELPKTPVQTVQPVPSTEKPEEKKAVESSKAVNTLKSKNSKTGKQTPTPPENYRGM